jgi:hypothetical protein
VGRFTAVVAVAVLLAAGCGGSTSSRGGTLDAVLQRPGPDVGITVGAMDFVPGAVRFPFLVIKSNAQPVDRPTAEVWVAKSKDSRPFARTTAPLEPIGIPGTSSPAFGGVTHMYVAHFDIPRPGRYWLVAQPKGARIQAVAVFDVRARSDVPAVGAEAPHSATPTLAGEKATALTTRRPADLTLLRYSIAGSLAAHRPFVVTFATPKFCTSRTCGPVVDVMEVVRRRFASRGVRFLHVEVFRDNDPSKGYNRWMRQWHLVSEPWTFLVGRDGRVKARFEGSVSEAELAAAVRHRLL